MSESTSNNDYEIDLINIYKLLWKKRLIVIIFLIISLLLATFYIYIKDSKYQSDIFLTPDASLPFYDLDKNIHDFKKLFFSSIVFNDWKKNNNESIFANSYLETTNIIEGFVFSKNESDNFISIDGKTISIKSRDHKIINEVFIYTNYVNLYLNTVYLNQSKKELDIITKNLNQQSDNTRSLSALLSRERFISDIESGSNIFLVSRPTIPYMTSVNSIMIYLFFSAIGIFTGILFIFYKNLKNN